MTEEHHEHVEHKTEEHVEHETKVGKKKRFEDVSFYVIVISAIMVSIGIGLGSFIQYTVFIAVLGAFFVMVGIVIYIASQFMEDKNG